LFTIKTEAKQEFVWQKANMEKNKTVQQEKTKSWKNSFKNISVLDAKGARGLDRNEKFYNKEH